MMSPGEVSGTVTGPFCRSLGGPREIADAAGADTLGGRSRAALKTLLAERLAIGHSGPHARYSATTATLSELMRTDSPTDS